MSEFSYEKYQASLSRICPAPAALKSELQKLNENMTQQERENEKQRDRALQNIEQQRRILIQQYDSIREECAILGINQLPPAQKEISSPLFLKDALNEQNSIASGILTEIQNIRQRLIDEKNEAKRQEQIRMAKEKAEAEEKARAKAIAEEKKRLENEQLLRLEQQKKLEEEAAKRKKEEMLRKAKSLAPFGIALLIIIVIVLISNR